MMFRSLVAGVCTVCCIAAVLPPVEASARSGGLTIGRGLMVRGAILRPGRRPSSLIGRGSALVAKSAVDRNFLPAHVAPLRFRHAFGARLPYAGIGVAWPYPPVQTVADAAPLPAGDGVVIDRRCGSQTVIVPSESGGARPVTVTRCRSE